MNGGPPRANRRADAHGLSRDGRTGVRTPLLLAAAAVFVTAGLGLRREPGVRARRGRTSAHKPRGDPVASGAFRSA